MALNPSDFLAELRQRLDNSAIEDTELLTYLTAAMRDVRPSLYSATDYIAQVLDTACQYLLDDNKFPEVTSISSGGVSTSFAGDGPDRFKKRINARRQAAWMS